MFAALTLAVLIPTQPLQTINGVKPIYDPTPKFAQAQAKQMGDIAEASLTPDMFAAGFYSMKVKSMVSLVQTKYTAAQFGICGTMIGAHDLTLGNAIKSAGDRISKGDKDFDSFTEAEQEAIRKAFSNDKSPFNPVANTNNKGRFDRYIAGGSLGSLCAFTTIWHISPKQPTLLKLIGDAVDGCAEAGAKNAESLDPEIATNLKGFARFKGKTYDEATMKEISGQIEATLKSAVPAKFRW